MKRIIILTALLCIAISSFGDIPINRIVSKELTSFKNIYAMYSTSNEFEVGYADSYDQRISSNDTSGLLWLPWGVNSFGFEFKIINDTTIFIESIYCACEAYLGNDIFNVAVNDDEYQYSIPVYSNAYLRNKNELHFDFTPETLEAINKTNIFKEGYLDRVLYLYKIENAE